MLGKTQTKRQLIAGAVLLFSAVHPCEFAAEAGFVSDLRMEGSDMMTMTYVLEVKTSMKAAKLEFLTSMLWKEAASLLEQEHRGALHARRHNWYTNNGPDKQTNTLLCGCL